MGDILEGRILDVVDGETLELDVETVEGDQPGVYGARELVRVAEGIDANRAAAADDESAALMVMTYVGRRVRCFVEERDQVGRIIGTCEVLEDAQPDEPYDFDARTDEGMT